MRRIYEKIYGEKPLGVLVRSVVGLSRKAAKEVFSEFLSESSLHPDQMAFLDEDASKKVIELVRHVNENAGVANRTRNQ